MAKSPDAFRTISEVSEWLDTPAHVLRFWESKFTQIKPVKRAGGRRYYRPEDMALLGGIKTLLHEQGMTIKGVQKLLREQGIRHVAALGPQPLDPEADPSDETSEGAAGEIAESMTGGQPAALEPVLRAAPARTSDRGAAEKHGAPPPARVRADGPVTSRPAMAAGPARRPDRLAGLPADPPAEAQAGPGILSAILSGDPARLARRSTGLAPVAARLAALRDRLRATL